MRWPWQKTALDAAIEGIHIAQIANAPNVRNVALNIAASRQSVHGASVGELLIEADKVAKWLMTGELPAANVTSLRTAE